MRARSTDVDARSSGGAPYHRSIASIPREPTTPDATAPLPSPLARAVAVLFILIAGLCGGLIGYAVTDLQTSGDADLLVGLGALLGAVVAAGGVAVVAVLALRAMAEWDTVQERERQKPR